MASYYFYEIENFEDKNGNGSYEASYGHDDIVMTLAQIPMLQQTPKYKQMCEDLESLRHINAAPEIWNPYEQLAATNYQVFNDDNMSTTFSI